MIGSRAGEETDGWWVASAAIGGAAFVRRDWAATGMGPLTGWSSGLRAAVSLVLASPVPMALWWGPDATLIHNDAHARIFDDVQGAPGARAWPGQWATWAPLIEQVRNGGTAARLEQEHLIAALSPVFDDTGETVGVLSIVTETPADSRSADGFPAVHDLQAAGSLRSRPAGWAPYGLDGATERRRTGALARLSAALSIATTARDVIQAVALHTNTVLDATQTRVGLLDDQHAQLTVRESGPDHSAAAVVELEAHDPLADTIRQDQPITQSASVPAGERMIRSLTVPMRYNDGEPLGAVQVCWEPPIVTTDVPGMGAVRNMLDTVAGLCSQALQRAQLIEATERVAALAAQLSAGRTTTQAIQAILTAAPQILGARLLSVAVPEGGRRLRLWHQDLPTGLADQYADLTIDDPRPIAEALRTRTRIIIADRDDYRARYPGLPDTAAAHGLTTTIAVPLLNHQGQPLAAIGMGWSRHRPLRAPDLALLDTITDLCEQTLERTRLAAAEHDLVTRLAGRVTTAPPRHAEFDVAVRYQPALTGLNLGGDWYDIIALPSGRLAVIVGDVVGHQVESAADMAQLRTVLNTLVRLDTPLPDVFARATTLLGRGFYGTAIIMILDPDTGLLHVTRAGHPHPLLLPATGPAHVLDTPANPPLGMVHGPATISTCPFNPGDMIIAYTDGLVERRSRPYDHGVEDLRTVLTEAAGLPLDAIADTILDRIPGTEDDRALTLVRRR